MSVNEPNPYVILDIGRKLEGSLSDGYEKFKSQLQKGDVLVCLLQKATSKREDSAVAMHISSAQMFICASQASGFASKKFYAVPQKKYEEYMNC
mgnify:CR=1 FL=1